MAKIGVAKENEWFYPRHTNFRHVCCDCGLTHTVDFQIDDFGIKMRFKRNDVSTSLTRRQTKYKCRKVNDSKT